jgi:hypothetical protein
MLFSLRAKGCQTMDETAIILPNQLRCDLRSRCSTLDRSIAFLASVTVIHATKFCNPSLYFSISWRLALVACARPWNAVCVHRYTRTRQECCPSVEWNKNAVWCVSFWIFVRQLKRTGSRVSQCVTKCVLLTRKMVATQAMESSVSSPWNLGG